MFYVITFYVQFVAALTLMYLTPPCCSQPHPLTYPCQEQLRVEPKNVSWPQLSASPWVTKTLLTFQLMALWRSRLHLTRHRQSTSTWRPWRRHPTASLEPCQTASTTWSGKVRKGASTWSGTIAVLLCSIENMDTWSTEVGVWVFFTSVLADDLPRMVRGGARVIPCNVMEQCEGLMELDQVDGSGRRWRKFCICGQEYHVNMSVLEPYLQVLSHGGQKGSDGPVVPMN